MKYMFASDVHGSAYYAKKLVEKFNEIEADRLILCGDLLYHGPRNDLPRDYSPKEVIPLFNSIKDKIYAVRGNCDSEVDQMVLEFPILSDYTILVLNGINFYLTHGHLHSPENLPALKKGDAFIFGHIHLPIAEKKDDIYILNPGSTSIPKGGNPNSYAILEDRNFKVISFDGEVLREIDIE